MIAEELRIVVDLSVAAQARFAELIEYGELIADGTEYRLSIPSYKIPWKSGRRTVAQQDELYAQGRTRPGAIVTNAKGNPAAPHVQGRALHLGFRHKATSAWLEYGAAETPAEVNELHKLLVEKARRLGIVCGFDFKPFTRGVAASKPVDPHHFEIRA